MRKMYSFENWVEYKKHLLPLHYFVWGVSEIVVALYPPQLSNQYIFLVLVQYNFEISTSPVSHTTYLTIEALITNIKLLCIVTVVGVVLTDFLMIISEYILRVHVYNLLRRVEKILTWAQWRIQDFIKEGAFHFVLTVLIVDDSKFKKKKVRETPGSLLYRLAITINKEEHFKLQFF